MVPEDAQPCLSLAMHLREAFANGQSLLIFKQSGLKNHLLFLREECSKKSVACLLLYSSFDAHTLHFFVHVCWACGSKV